MVASEIQPLEAVEGAQFGRDGAAELVVGEVQALEVLEAAQLGRYGSRQLVVKRLPCR